MCEILLHYVKLLHRTSYSPVGRPGMAFVKFANAADRDRAVASLNGYVLASMHTCTRANTRYQLQP